MQDLVASGQLKVSNIPTEKNPADVLTKCLTASTLHKLLPKLGMMTRAADSKDLLSMISFEWPACSLATPDSFFIGMMAEESCSDNDPPRAGGEAAMGGRGKPQGCRMQEVMPPRNKPGKRATALEPGADSCPDSLSV